MALLPDTTLEQSLVVASRICEMIRNTPFEAEGDFLPITVSLGVSYYRKTDTLNDLIKRADDGLYQAKADGRDRVSWVFRPGDGETVS
jgi:diguanylate cyclase (GGDEF)-like protein